MRGVHMSEEGHSDPFAPLLSDPERQLGLLRYELEAIAAEISHARAKNDLRAFQAGCISWLQALEYRLMPIVGRSPLQPGKELLFAVEAALAGKRHWLTGLRGDDMPARQDCPVRTMLFSMAVAILHYFSNRPGAHKGKTANEIMAAMKRGRFHAASGRALEKRLELYLSRGPRNRRRARPVAKDMFNQILGQIQAYDPTGERSDAYFKQQLSRLTRCCLSEAPLTLSDSEPTTPVNSTP